MGRQEGFERARGCQMARGRASMACISCSPRGVSRECFEGTAGQASMRAARLQEATRAQEGRSQPVRHHAAANFCRGKPRMLLSPPLNSGPARLVCVAVELQKAGPGRFPSVLHAASLAF